ncbi:MAG: hypothetical protein E6I87_07430 [Chloroflexi bacterium]|nr:MAG: hypothetical protein E6I87_07430 [Chloroflexota bacterium]
MAGAVATHRRGSSPLGRVALAGLIAIGAGWAYGQWTSFPLQPLATDSASPPTAQLANAERALAQAQQSGKSVPVTLTFSDAELTATAREDLPSSYSGFTITNPAVRIETGTLTLNAQAMMGPLGGPLLVMGRPMVSSGRASVTLESATVAGVPLPDQTRASIAASIDQAIASLVPAKLRLTSIVARPGVLTIQATAQP